MIRLFENWLLFFLPFAIYAIWLYVTKRSPFLRRNWKKHPVILLSVIGAVLFVAGLFAIAYEAGLDPNSAYVPAHMENGQLVPGKMMPAKR
jgi:glucan phosphoethanolaminetransferase (alkaline phosphatase superfamily)